MTEIAPRPPLAATAAGVSYVDWSAIIAGAAIAAALSWLLMGFGTALGLSATSPWRHESGLSVGTLAYLAVAWIAVQHIAAMLAGGYVAGRMRARFETATTDEVAWRDGVHGGLVWAIAVIASACLALAAAGSALQTAGQAGIAAANSDLVKYQVGVLMRAPDGKPSQALPNETRDEITGVILRSMANGRIAAPDRTYLTDIVAQRTGLSREESGKRVDAAYAETVRLAKEAADTARKAGIAAGVVTAVGLLVSLTAAWWAAIAGGNHRDTNRPAHFGPALLRRN